MTAMNQMMLQSITKTATPTLGLLSDSPRALTSLLILVTILVSILGITQIGGST